MADSDCLCAVDGLGGGDGIIGSEDSAGKERAKDK